MSYASSRETHQDGRIHVSTGTGEAKSRALVDRCFSQVLQLAEILGHSTAGSRRSMRRRSKLLDRHSAITTGVDLPL